MARALLPVLLVGLVLVVDAVDSVTDLPLVLQGPLDWTGHLATTGIALLAASRLGLRLPPAQVLVVLAATVVIDADHVPLYAGLPVKGAGGRPFTHGLWLPAVLLLAAALAPRARALLSAAAAGLLLHQLRDTATGPGLPWLWPVGDALVVPYGAYVGLLAAAALVAASGAYSVGSSPPRRR